MKMDNFMEIEIDKTQLKKLSVDIEEFLARLSTGKGILFTGAGFSIAAKDVAGEEPSVAKELAKEICRLGEFDEDEDLRFATDYYISKFNKAKLVSLLKEKYTLQSTSEIQNKICSLNWRRFYTTNYDKAVEIASANSGKVVECIDSSFPATTYYKRDGLCIHLNGSIESLSEESLESSFKLSTSSYISPDSFLSSDWHYYFKKDLERASAIVFVGYSMYDVEIQKILFQNQSLKEKTYFITRENPTPKTEFTLSRFGHVLPIGVEGFARLIKDNESELIGSDVCETLQSLELYEVSQESTEIRDADVETMIMYGDISKNLVDDGVVSEQRIPYLIIRYQLDEAKKFIDENKNIVFYGDMGNGKSMLLRELQAHLSLNSIDCYHIIDWEGDYIGDIDLLSKSGKKSVIVIDGYERYLDLVRHYCGSMPSNIMLIATARTAEHERLRQYLKSIDFEYNELCIDLLSIEESSSLVDIVDNLGMWGEKAGMSNDRKVDFIQNKNSAQISLTLLAIFNSPQIRDRIALVLENLITDSKVKDTIFAIALIEVLDMPCKFSLISDIADDDIIYSASLQQNEAFKSLFKSSGLEIKAKSSIFCLSLIKNHFTPTYVINQLQKIAKKLDGYNRNDYEQMTIFKSTLRFSFIERIIPGESKKNSLRRYYEDLKISVPWLKNDPHFWLQYGMANITFKEYGKAQQFFDQSYSLARKKDGYYTSNIDTQQARLYLLIAMKELDGSKIYEGFSKCHKILNSLDNDVYKFRQVEKYRDFYESCFSKLSKKNKVGFQHACKAMNDSIDNAVSNGEINVSEQRTIIKAKNNLDHVLSSMARII
jgi:hypothetical protein